MNKFRSAAIQILSSSRRALHVKEITRRALKKGILKTTGATPAASMNAQIITDIQKKGLASDFVKTGPSKYKLNRKKRNLRKPSSKPTLKGALVTGYLEKKDRKGFELLLPRYNEVIGGSSGIYALYKGKKLYYVGLAQNLLNRVAWHLKDRHKKRWDKVSFFVINRHRFSKDIETVILRIAEPKGNGTRGKFEKHYELQDKLNQIRREMKDLIKRV